MIKRTRTNKKPQAYAFIDSQNLNLGTQKAGWKLDWRKFRKHLQSKYGVTKAFLFIGYIPENEELYLQMHDAGYLVVLKPTHDMTRPPEEKPEQTAASDGDDKKPIKGNIDAELVLWAMKEQDNYEQAVVVSGDGDFYCLIEHLEEHGKLGAVLVPNRFFSGLFNKYKQHIVRLDKYKRALQYRR